MTTTVPFGTPTFPTFGTQTTPTNPFFGFTPGLTPGFTPGFTGFTPGFTPGFNPFTGIPFGYAYPGTPIASTMPGNGCCSTTTNGATTVTPTTQAWTANGVPTPDQTIAAQGFVGQPGVTYPFGYAGTIPSWNTPFAYNPFVGGLPNFGGTPTFGNGFAPTFGANSPWGWTPGATSSVFGQTPWFQPSFTNSIYGTPTTPTTFPFAQNNWFSPTSAWTNPFSTLGWTGGVNPFSSVYPQSIYGSTQFPYGSTQFPTSTPWTNSFLGTGTTGVTPWSFQQTPYGVPSFSPGFVNGFYGAQPFSTLNGYTGTTFPTGIFSYPQNVTGMTTAGCFNGYQPSFYTPGVSVPFGYGAVPFSTPFGIDANGRRGIGIREAA